MKTTVTKFIATFLLVFTTLGLHSIPKTFPALDSISYINSDNQQYSRNLLQPQADLDFFYDLEKPSATSIEITAKVPGQGEPEVLALGSNYMGTGYDQELHQFIVSEYRTQPINYLDGIDVSNWQGSINWNQINGGGYTFAFTKATEGAGYDDPYFATNMNNATSAGVHIGPYHFARPDLVASGNTLKQDAYSEANYFKNATQAYLVPGNLRPVLDLEVSGTLSWGQLSNWTENFMYKFEQQTGIEPIIYINSYYANNLDQDLTQYDIWIAHWTYNTNNLPNTGKWGDWLVWQYSNQGTVPGTTGRIDLNISNGNLDEVFIQ